LAIVYYSIIAPAQLELLGNVGAEIPWNHEIKIHSGYSENIEQDCCIKLYVANLPTALRYESPHVTTYHWISQFKN